MTLSIMCIVVLAWIAASVYLHARQRRALRALRDATARLDEAYESDIAVVRAAIEVVRESAADVHALTRAALPGPVRDEPMPYTVKYAFWASYVKSQRAQAVLESRHEELLGRLSALKVFAQGPPLSYSPKPVRVAGVPADRASFEPVFPDTNEYTNRTVLKPPVAGPWSAGALSAPS